MRVWDVVHRGLAILALLGVIVTSAYAQTETQQRRREVVDGLLKSLLESQLPQGSAATQPVRADAVRDPKVREAVTLLISASAEAQRLANALQNDAYRAPGVRPLLGDAINLSADVTAAARNLARSEDVEANREDLRAIDRNWRLLSYRLRQVSGLSTETMQLVDRGDQFEKRLTELLQVTPQLDRWELVRQSASLENDLEDLIEDIRLEVTNVSEMNRLVSETSNVLRQAQRVNYVAGRSNSYDEIRTEYQAFHQGWSSLAVKLRSYGNRVLERQMRRVHASDRKLQELLLLPQNMDREQVVYLATILQQDVERFADNVNLRTLAGITTNRDQVVAAAANFYTSCRDFVQIASTGDSQQTLTNVYYYLQDDWQRLRSLSGPLQVGAAGQALISIDAHMTELRALLGAPDNTDRTRAGELVTALATNGSQFEQELQRIFAQPNRYTRELQLEGLRAARQFRSSIQVLYDGLTRLESQTELRRRSNDVVRDWELLNRAFGQLNGNDQNRLTPLRRQLTQQIVSLQTTFALNAVAATP